MGQLVKGQTSGRRQRFWAMAGLILGAAVCLIPGGCKRRPAGETTKVPTTTAVREVRPTVASLVPAATDLLLGMGVGDHLVAVSHYDTRRPGTANLPRVGDYQNFDWEQLGVLRPDLLIVFMDPQRMPVALRQRAEQLQITLVNCRTERLADIYAEIDHLGQLVREPAKAAMAASELRRRLDAVRRRVASLPPAPTLVVREATGDGVVGRDTFINDILEIAGGVNVVNNPGWPSLDREMLVSLKPQVIVELLPEASPQVIGQARQVWQTMPAVPAVANGRVYIIDQWWAVQPGVHVADLAEKMAELLHGTDMAKPPAAGGRP